jgi:MFS transporter, ACS family, pantothenate transporter
MRPDTIDIGTSIWTVGYVIGQIPSNLLLTRVSPRWVIPALEVGWGIATICTASVQSYKSLYALRFLVGLFEYVSSCGLMWQFTTNPRTQIWILPWHTLHAW